MKNMKKLSLLAFFVCIIFCVSNVDGQCNNDIINLLDQLDELVADYANLESVLNKCLVGADNIFSNGLTSLNNYLDSRDEVRVVDYLNFLARLPVDMVEYADRYDALAAGNATLDSLDQLWLTYVQSIPKTLYDLNNYYKKIKKITGDSQKYAAVLDNVITRFPLDQISLEYNGTNQIGQSSSLVADLRSFAQTVDQFCKELARLLLDYQPINFPTTVGFSLSERDLMFSYSYAVANYSKSPKLEARPFRPKNATDALSKLYDFLETMTYQYNLFFEDSSNLIPTFVSFLYLPFSYRSILFSASIIADTFGDLGFNGNNLSNLSLASSILDSLFASLPNEYEDSLYNSVPIGASKNNIDNLSILLPDVDQNINLLIPAVSAYQPAGYNCIKGAFSSLNDVTFGIEILRKKFNVAGLDSINNAIDTIGNQLKAVKLIINDYNQVHSLVQPPSEMSFFMVKLLKLIIKSWRYDIESKNYIFRQAPNYYYLYQALIGLDIDSINSEYNAIKSGSLNAPIAKSDLINALEILMPNIESLQTELVEIYTRMQDERDVPLLTTNAQKLLANYNSIKSELALPNQTLVRGVFNVMTQKIRELYDECGNLQPRFQQPNATDLKNVEFLLYTLLTFGSELTAINQTYPLPVQQTIQAQSASQGVQVLAATSSLAFNFDTLAEVIQALSSQLTKLISIIEFVVNNPPQTRTVTRSETIFSETPVFQIQIKTESLTKSETKTSTKLNKKTRTKWRANKIHTTTTKKRTKLKTKYLDNWLTHTITNDRDVTRTHIIKEPITIIETIHNRYENNDFEDKFAHTIEVEVVRTKTERRERIRTETMDKMRTETKWRTKTIRKYWQDGEEKNNRKNYWNKKDQDRENRRRDKNRNENYDDDDKDTIERKIEQALKKKMFNLD